MVDRLLQFWLYREQYDDTTWLDENFEMVWNMIHQQNNPAWESTVEREEVLAETMLGLHNAVRMLKELDLKRYQLVAQPHFFEQIHSDFAITGAADLLMLAYERDEHVLIDFKNAHNRDRMTRDQLLIYQMGLEKSLDIKIARAGYLLFNPRLQQWKWIPMNPVHRERLKDKLAEATYQVESGQFKFKYNYYSCSRFCDARFACEKYKRGDQRIYETHPVYHI